MEGVLYLPLSVQELKPTEEERAARLRVPIGYRDASIRETERELLSVIQPAMSAVRVKISREKNGDLRLGGIRTGSEALTRNLEGCDEAFLFAVTLGMGCERWLHRLALLSAAKHFLADGLASAYAEAAADLANEILSQGHSLTKRFSPGYGDLPLSLQRDLIFQTEANKYLHIELKESLLMVPQKSITAIIGIRA